MEVTIATIPCEGLKIINIGKKCKNVLEMSKKKRMNKMT